MIIVYANDTVHTLREIAAWDFVPSGSFADDNARGRGLAREFVAQSDHDRFAPALGWLVARLVERGEALSGLEIGFFAQLSNHLAGNAGAPPLTLCSA